MRRRIFAAVILTLVCSSPVSAWGFRAHRTITGGAVDISPQPLREFLSRHVDDLVAHSIDPDLWVEQKILTPSYAHFIDLDELDNAPFAGIPRDFASAVEKYGLPAVEKAGTLPWEIARREEALATAFREGRWDDAIRESAWISHFIADSTMPLHTTKDYRGEAAGNVVLPNDRSLNRHAHIRIESGLIEFAPARFEAVRGDVARVASEPNLLDDTWRTLRESYALIAPALAGDRGAYALDPTFGPAFYAELEKRDGSLVEARMKRAQERIASAWLTAWENAGRPALPERVAAVTWPEGGATTPSPGKIVSEKSLFWAALAAILVILLRMLRRRRRRLV